MANSVVPMAKPPTARAKTASDARLAASAVEDDMQLFQNKSVPRRPEAAGSAAGKGAEAGMALGLAAAEMPWSGGGAATSLWHRNSTVRASLVQPGQ